MSHVLFAIRSRPELDDQEKNRVAYLRDKLQTVEGLGLEAQAVDIKSDLATVARGRLIATAPMTEAELTIWRAWLPTVYTDVENDTQRNLADYRFDRIPQPVLKAWESHKLSGAFERFEIWTPANNQPDPILVGVNGSTRHLLARWGESDASLVAFHDIINELMRKWYAGTPIHSEPTAEWSDRRNSRDRDVSLAVGCMIAMYFIIAIVGGRITGLSESGLPFGYQFVGILLAGAVAAVFGLMIFHFSRHSTLKRLADSSSLMRAFREHRSVQRELLPAN